MAPDDPQLLADGSLADPLERALAWRRLSAALFVDAPPPEWTQGDLEALAQAWGARFVDYGERGHINAESGLGDWAEGHGWLQQLAAA